MLDYKKIIEKNMLNVLKDILKHIQNYGITNDNHLYITLLTNHKKNKIPKWIQSKYPEEMTIIIQYEYYDIKVNKNNFNITLSFNDIRETLKIDYESIISFADPSANFGLKLVTNKIQKNPAISIGAEKENKKNNIINFSKYKKN